ncbi:MAG: hypothetical protein Q9M40_12085 [Sulfurimonas sp.]|nr:hypothetical protein [Sulfurimonas sp.]
MRFGGCHCNRWGRDVPHEFGNGVEMQEYWEAYMKPIERGHPAMDVV